MATIVTFPDNVPLIEIIRFANDHGASIEFTIDDQESAPQPVAGNNVVRLDAARGDVNFPDGAA